MSYKYSAFFSPKRVIRNDGQKMLIWMTQRNISKIKKEGFLHMHTADVKDVQKYNHLGDWTLINVRRERMTDHRGYKYQKCCLEKLRREN